jgi:hypothetical protein
MLRRSFIAIVRSDVALKIMPHAFADDRDRVVSFILDA